MLTHIPKLLTGEALADARRLLDAADWTDGRATAGHLSGQVKNNVQLAYDHPAARRLGQLILARLEQNGLFMSAALPQKIVPPLFNRYAGGQSYGSHVDGAVRPVEGTPHRVRTDLSATVFFSEPDEYDGGELVIEDAFGPRMVKLPAGDMVLYPGTSIHRVEPVIRGARLASFFWIQSLVRNGDDRAVLFELDGAIQAMQQQEGIDRANVLRLTNVYHNLLRRWAET